jgi:hypothetical protein
MKLRAPGHSREPRLFAHLHQVQKMEIAIIAAVLLLWLVLGGIVAILICPLLKQGEADASGSAPFERPRETIAPHAPSESYR